MFKYQNCQTQGLRSASADAVKTLSGRICPMELCGRGRGTSRAEQMPVDETKQSRETNALVSLAPEKGLGKTAALVGQPVPI